MLEYPNTLADQAVLVTGANRGLGAALVAEALRRGARRVYAGTRQDLHGVDDRVVPVRLDVTNPSQIGAAARAIDRLNLLINNAGVGHFEDLTNPAVLAEHLRVNLYGPHAVAQAVLPKLIASGGSVVNVLSIAALASLPVMASYSVSKAAAFSLTQAQRALFAGRGVRVHAVLAGPMDTDMVRDMAIPKSQPAEVARSIYDGVLAGREDIFPDPMTAALEEGWDNGPLKALERQNAGFVGVAS
ncbi:MAG TPA: SDR family NAD(P)-dependent oxidoreductase [Propionibacteriaceae bacterium]|nr:SDR family NAD(P)-dependent oxidoreductase [Propionibacteriaceae bacterium]